MYGAQIDKSGRMWSGVIGKVMNQTSQMGIGDIAINEKRHNVVEFLRLLYPIDTYFVTVKPRPYLSYWNMLRPFTSSVWICILTSLLAATLVLSLLTLLRQKWMDSVFRAQVREAKSQTRLWNLARLRLLLLRCQLPLQPPLIPHAVQYEKPIDSEEDVIEQNRGVFLLTGSALEAEILHHGHVTMNTRERALVAVAEAERRYGYRPFRLGKKVIFHLYAGFVIPKNTFWNNEINAVISPLIEGGIIARLLDKYIPGKYLVEEPEDSSPVAFRLVHIVGAMIVLCFGLSLSSIVLLSENITFRYVST
ncbi:unnamed protein product [Sphagnum tenellum]